MRADCDGKDESAGKFCSFVTTNLSDFIASEELWINPSLTVITTT